MKVFGIVLTTVFGFLLLIQAVVVVTMYVVFDRNCEGYLKRAADSNTVEMASRELKKSLDYIESHNLTKGFTSVLYTTPDEDIEFWYTNVKSCYESLIKLKPNATELEKSNMLMKLRETLLDQKKETVGVTMPSGIQIYPYNTLFAVISNLTWIFILLGAFLWFIKSDMYW